MTDGAADGRLFDLFADLLEYPRPGLADAARECERLLLSECPEGATELREFRQFAEGASPGRLEEVYSGVFDLNPTCSPYVGYHLLGETYQRSVFLLELRARFRAEGFAHDHDLPDHLAVLLRFLARSADSALRAELIEEALLPALDRMTGRARSAGYDADGAEQSERRSATGPYGAVLRALRRALERRAAEAGALAGAAGVEIR